MHGEHGSEFTGDGRYRRISLSALGSGGCSGEGDGQMPALMASIARHGLLQPVVVRRAGAGYALVCGRRRAEACRRLGMRYIDAVCIDADELDALCCSLEEHHTRREIHFLSELEQMRGHSFRALCTGSTLPPEFFAERMRARSLGEAVCGVITRERMSLAQCEPLYLIADEARREEAAALIAQRQLTPGQAWRLVCGRMTGQTGRKAQGSENHQQAESQTGRKRRRRAELHIQES